MQPIRVPKPSPDAFHKKRRISDLLFSQVQHFKHVAEQKSLNIDRDVARDVHTEGGAARFIGTVTQALRHRAPSEATDVVSIDRDSGERHPAKNPAAGKVKKIAARAESKGRHSKKEAAGQAETKKRKKAGRASSTGVKKKSRPSSKSAKKGAKATSKRITRTKPRKKS